MEEAGAEPEARPSPALSELSGEPGVEELQAVLQESYDPRKEGIESFEARINRAAEGLQMLGIEVVDRQAEILLEASAIKEVYGVTSSLEPAVMVRTARDFFVGVSVDPLISDLERRNRAQGYASLIRTFGGKTSADPTKLFSTPSLSKEVGGGLLGWSVLVITTWATYNICYTILVEVSAVELSRALEALSKSNLANLNKWLCGT